LADPSLGVYRSVVFKGDTIVCFSPPKCIPLDEFRAKHAFDAVRVERFVDGTMVNAFFDGEWKFATKSNVGATNTFYERTFLDLIGDAPLPPLDPTFSYSFVLQHPGCRNITPVNRPSLVQVASYRVEGSAIVERRHLDAIEGGSYETLLLEADSMPWSDKGFILVAGNDRAKIMPRSFLRAAHVKGNDSQFGFRYLELCHQNLVSEYLSYFPERAAEAAQTQKIVSAFSENLFAHYKRRGTPPYAYRPHVSKLHKYQKSCLSPIPLSCIDVSAYVAALPPAQLMYALNKDR
jgi:hypothetical protein